MPITTIPQQPDRTPELINQAFQTFIQLQMMKEQNKVEKERLSLAERQIQLQEASSQREAEAARAAGVAGQTEIGLQAQADPAIMQFIQSQFPQTRVDPNAIAQMAAGAIRGQPQATAQAGSQVVRPQFDPRQIPVDQAAAVADRVRGFRQSQAELDRSAAATEASRAQTRAAEQAMRHADVLFPLEQEELRTSIEANRETTLSQKAARRNLAVQDARDAQRLFADLSTILGPGYASVSAFGTATPPSQEALVAAAAERIGILEEVARTNENPREAYANLLESQQRTEIAQRLGLQPEDQNFLDQTIERVGFTETYRLAREAVGQEGSLIAETDLPIVAAYLKTQYPHFVIPPEDVGFLRRLWQRVTRPSPASPSSDPATNTRRRAGGGVM